ANLVIKDQEDPQVCQVLQVQRDPEETEVNEDQRGCRGFLDVRGTQDELELREMMDVLVLMDRRANLETRVHRGLQENGDQRGRRCTIIDINICVLFQECELITYIRDNCGRLNQRCQT
ncbi:hypothetical protein GOODEAATRI_030723, partial [Goodea atripinnis]